MPDAPRTYTHPAGAQPARADKALAAFLGAEISRSRLGESFRLGKVSLRGVPVEKNFKLSAGDTLEFTLPEPPPATVSAADIPLKIVYEDDDIVVVDKPAGMTVHPGNGTGEDTLVHAMMHHTGGKLSLAGGAMRPGIVHRLDRETSGVLVMAKTDAAYYGLVEMFSKRKLEKEYAALVCGVPSVRSGRIKTRISRHPVFRTKMCVSDGGGRDAETEWRLEKSYGGRAALLSCRILTGRTHQIRVHLSHLGFPLLGDYAYKFQKNKMKEIPPPERVMLHAERLAFSHPTNPGKFVEAAAEPPDDFKNLEKLLEETYESG